MCGMLRGMTTEDEEDYFAGRDDQQAGTVDVERAVRSEAYRRGMADQRSAGVDAELREYAAAGAGVVGQGDVAGYLLAAFPPEALAELAALVDEEGQRLLEAALQGEVPTAYEVAGYQRRRAAVWTRLATDHPRPGFEARAEAARSAWLAAEGRHAQEAVLRATGASGAE